jgi:tetratricopeptide (TPR) repeat protein
MKEHSFLYDALEGKDMAMLETISEEMLIETAAVLLKLGITKQTSSYLLQAHHCLDKALQRAPQLFSELTPWHLWGRVFVALDHLLKDSAFLQEAISHYETAEKLASGAPSFEFWWDLGQAWILLGQSSGEVGDFKKGLHYYQRAATIGATSRPLMKAYATALAITGKALGDLSLLQRALELLTGIITEGVPCGSAELTIYQGVWVEGAHVAKEICFFTGDPKDLKRADRFFQDRKSVV